MVHQTRYLNDTQANICNGEKINLTVYGVSIMVAIVDNKGTITTKEEVKLYQILKQHNNGI